jgi:hypothetical protein
MIVKVRKAKKVVNKTIFIKEQGEAKELNMTLFTRKFKPAP